MAFMMPVVKNDWDIYNSQRSRRQSEAADKGAPGGRVRKVSESRSEGPALAGGPGGSRAAALSPHRSAPAMHARSLSYCRAPPSSRGSLRGVPDSPGPRGSASPPARDSDKFSSRARGHGDAGERPSRSRCACMPYL